MSKKELSRLADAYEKSRPKRVSLDNEADKDFAVSFTTDDFQCITRDGKVSVTARIPKNEFENIIYSYGIYIIDYLAQKGLIKQQLNNDKQ